MLKFSVGSITSYIRQIITHDINLRQVEVEGEVCAFKQPNLSGHLYFDIKDERARLKCVYFNIKDDYASIPFEEGDKVKVIGRVELYEKSGTYQLIVKEVKIEGEGRYLREYLELKEKLKNEGLFELTKRSLPAFPSKLGIITSRTGAAINDVISVVKRRYPILDVILYPVHVQGEKTVREVVQGFDYFDETDVDVVLMTRGGGSYEELSVFNDEAIARRIVQSIHPTVSAIGHQEDFFICDFCADIRAATPTAAAEIITPNLMAVNLEIKNRFKSLYDLKYSEFNRKKQELESYKELVRHLSPVTKINSRKSQLVDIDKNLEALVRVNINYSKSEIIGLKARLNLFNFDELYNKGYSVTTLADGRLLKDANVFKRGEKVITYFKNGVIESSLEDFNGR